MMVVSKPDLYSLPVPAATGQLVQFNRREIETVGSSG